MEQLKRSSETRGPDELVPSVEDGPGEVLADHDVGAVQQPAARLLLHSGAVGVALELDGDGPVPPAVPLRPPHALQAPVSSARAGRLQGGPVAAAAAALLKGRSREM